MLPTVNFILIMAFALVFNNEVMCIPTTRNTPIDVENSATNIEDIMVFQGEKYDLSNFELAGDVLLTKSQIEDEVLEQSERYRREVVSTPNVVVTLWKDNVVPFVFNVGMTEEQKRKIRITMSMIERRLCVKFVEFYFPNRPKNFLAITLGTKCFGSVGAENIPLNVVSFKYPECFKRKTLLHELLHVLGLFHEQQRMDRDEYVKINWDNIQKGQEYNFRKVRSSIKTNVGYNKESIMHYKPMDFSNNGKATMECVNSSSCKLGGDWLTWRDVEQLRNIYNCPTIKRKC